VRRDCGGDEEKLEVSRAGKWMVWSGTETELQTGVLYYFCSDYLEQVRQQGLDEGVGGGHRVGTLKHIC
jgi:hypothetical protein